MEEDAYSRREELIAGALTGHLTDAEREELNNTRQADPSIDVELAELRVVAKRLKESGLTLSDETMPPGLEERIRAATSQTESQNDT
ncbi:hypothetical protein [Nesterenkonia sandarakina]|uniref:hypothetical protein n=1 Tax=Nesterenkonia sandarakina TaxID=272918 RepID=UPI0011B22B74|nr:hypothetical protein [Nesterenkonia sandarakina]